MRIDSKSDVGMVRDSNQDYFYCGLLPGNVAWAVVCDGMGGANGGFLASRLAVQMITENIEKSYDSYMDSKQVANLLLESVQKANTEVFDKSTADESLRGMGTTIVLAFIRGTTLHVMHAGDSRAYLITSDAIHPLTTDHSIVQEMVKSGEITEEQAKNHPRKNIITRALGVKADLELDYQEVSFEEGNSVLLCTDGLSNYLDDSRIFEICCSGTEHLAETLVSEAKKLGGSDNITVVILG